MLQHEELQPAAVQGQEVGRNGLLRSPVCMPCPMGAAQTGCIPASQYDFKLPGDCHFCTFQSSYERNAQVNPGTLCKYSCMPRYGEAFTSLCGCSPHACFSKGFKASVAVDWLVSGEFPFQKSCKKGLNSTRSALALLCRQAGRATKSIRQCWEGDEGIHSTREFTFRISSALRKCIK